MNTFEPASPEAQEAFEAIQVNDDLPKKGSMARELVEFVTSKAEVFHSPDNQAFVSFNAGNHDETWRIDSPGFREWLTASFFKDLGKIPSDAALKDAIRALSGKAKYEGKEIPVAIRCAMVSDGYLIDLCDSKWQAIHVTVNGWRIEKNPDVRFWRNSNMRPLPMPVSGEIDPLWQFVNVEDTDRHLLLAWMIECFRPDTPYPALELTGGQGSAKSTTQDNIRNLIDPNAVNLRARPKHVEDLFVGSINNYLASFENVSFLTAEMQDALCVLATGGGYAGRTLYTNSEETAITIKRPIIINGISANATAQDFVDRLIHLDLPTITIRKTSSELAQGFETAKPLIFGGILDLFVKSLSILPTVHIDKKPRMADFAMMGEAVYQAIGRKPGEFMREYEAMREQSIHRTLDNSPVALAIQSYLDSNPTGFDGTVKAAHETVSRHRTDSEERWPRTPKAFADGARRAATALRVIGIAVDVGGKTREGTSMSIRKVSNHVHNVHEVHTQDEAEQESVNMVNMVNEKTSFHGAVAAKRRISV